MSIVVQKYSDVADRLSAAVAEWQASNTFSNDAYSAVELAQKYAEEDTTFISQLRAIISDSTTYDSVVSLIETNISDVAKLVTGDAKDVDAADSGSDDVKKRKTTEIQERGKYQEALDHYLINDDGSVDTKNFGILAIILVIIGAVLAYVLFSPASVAE